MRFGKRGQVTLEYAVLLVTALSLLFLLVYGRRAVEGRVKEASDQIGPQYDPLFTTSEITTTTHRETEERVRKWDADEDSDQLIAPEPGEERLVREERTLGIERFRREGTDTISNVRPF